MAFEDELFEDEVFEEMLVVAWLFPPVRIRVIFPRVELVFLDFV